MKFPKFLLPVFAAVLLTACSEYSTPFDKSSAYPTPTGEQIAVLSPEQLPAHYTVLGNVDGSNIETLEKKARKMGADAIINPTSVDPVSGFATTQAIKFDK